MKLRVVARPYSGVDTRVVDPLTGELVEGVSEMNIFFDKDASYQPKLVMILTDFEVEINGKVQRFEHPVKKAVGGI